VEVREKLRMISRLAGSEPFRQLEICKVGSAIYAEKSFIVVQNGRVSKDAMRNTMQMARSFARRPREADLCVVVSSFLKILNPLRLPR